MNPPKKFELNFDWGNFWSNFKLSLIVLAINHIVIISLIIILYYLLNQTEVSAIVNQYKNGYQKVYFAPFKENIFNIFWQESLLPAIHEEAVFRGPIYIAIKHNFRLRVFKNITMAVLLPSILILNYLWVSWPLGHTNNLPVFITGLPLYWLVFKTRALWPSMLCHFLSNLSIYMLVQIFLYFKTI